MKSTFKVIAILAGSLLTFSACNQDNVPIQPGLPYQSSFQTGSDGWSAGITDFGKAQADIMEFKASWKGLPAPLDTTRKSLMLSSMNRSDDAFMFIKKKVTGLQPNKAYNLVFSIELASRYGENSIGIGGSPGGSVFLKAGASVVEPISVLKDDFYSLNIDKGEQNNDGKDAVRLGNIATSDDSEGYALITRTNADKPFSVTTNDKGELWLLVGTDSGFEGLTTLYYSKVNVTIQ